MEKNTETEIKLLLSEKDRKTLLSSPLVTGKTQKGSHKTLKLVNAYYDTRDLLLQRSGLAYRIRQTGRKMEATIKVARREAGGLTARSEYNVPAKSWKPDFSGFAGTGLDPDPESLLGTAQAEKLFSVRIKRDVRLLQVTKETLVEMAVDEGFVSAGGKKERIREIELELKEGTLGDLLAYAAKIAALVPVFSESRSKYARGMALLGKLPGGLQKPLLKAEGEADYSTEAKALLYRSGAGILAEQNVFGDSKLQTEADRIFLPYWEIMAHTLYWVRPALSAAAGMETNLRGVLLPLRGLRAAKALLARWRALYKSREEWLGGDKLARFLEQDIKARGEDIREKIAGGSYSAVIFSLWAAMEQSAWKAGEYLQVRQLLQVRTQAILDRVKAMVTEARKTRLKKLGILCRPDQAVPAAKEIGTQEACRLALELEEDLTYLLDPETGLKAAALGKDSRRRLEKLGGAFASWQEIRALRQAIPEAAWGVRSAAGNRQIGFLSGILAAEQAAAEKALGKAFLRWMKTLK